MIGSDPYHQRNMKRIQVVKDSRVQVKGVEFITLESGHPKDASTIARRSRALNPGILEPYF